MGLLIEGRWHDQWYDTESTGGKFVRTDAQFRNWITPDGEPGPGKIGGYSAESNRYHLYVSWACPWAHRTLLFRQLKGLKHHIDVSYVQAFMGARGWQFDEGECADKLFGESHMHAIYTRAAPRYSGRVTVPVLWDKHTQTIVSNESSEIIRMFNCAFNSLTGNKADYYPSTLREEIEAINEDVYPNLNNGVYRAGFATTQDAYDEAVTDVFACLDRLETQLSEHEFLAGDQITEADWRAFTTLVRFDKVYHGHFKCNKRRIVDYPCIWAYLRRLYQVEGVAETVNFDHITHHYYQSHETINPTRIVPIGPVLDFS